MILSPAISLILFVLSMIFGIIFVAKTFDYTKCEHENNIYAKNELWLPNNKYEICSCRYGDSTNIFYTIKEYKNNKFLCQLGFHSYAWENQSTYMAFDRDLLRFNSTNDVNKFINNINNNL
jgi:hypothetical protein